MQKPKTVAALEPADRRNRHTTTSASLEDGAVRSSAVENEPAGVITAISPHDADDGSADDSDADDDSAEDEGSGNPSDESDEDASPEDSDEENITPNVHQKTAAAEEDRPSMPQLRGIGAGFNSKPAPKKRKAPESASKSARKQKRSSNVSTPGSRSSDTTEMAVKKTSKANKKSSKVRVPPLSKVTRARKGYA